MAAEKSIIDFASNFARGFVGERPLFYKGRKIGYWKNLDSMCAAHVMLYPDAPKEALSDKTNWTTKDDMWRDIPATTYCVNNGIRPEWIKEKEYKQYQVAPPQVIAETRSDLKPWLLAGGLGVLSLLLLTRR